MEVEIILDLVDGQFAKKKKKSLFSLVYDVRIVDDKIIQTDKYYCKINHNTLGIHNVVLSCHKSPGNIKVL